MNYLNDLLFQVFPYVAIAVCLIGSWARFDLAAYTWRTGSSQLLSGKGMRLGSNLFHIGVLAILGGHFVGLLTPHQVYEPFICSPQKQVLAMVAGGVFGAVCFVGLTILGVAITTTGGTAYRNTDGSAMTADAFFAAAANRSVKVRGTWTGASFTATEAELQSS